MKRFEYRITKIDSLCPYAAQRREQGLFGWRDWKFFSVLNDGTVEERQTSFKHVRHCELEIMKVLVIERDY